mgnify:CR=1 FL=1
MVLPFVPIRYLQNHGSAVIIVPRRTTIAIERDIPTAAKWFFKIEEAASNLERFPLLVQPVPEKAFEQYYPEFAELRQLMIRPYRVVYEPTDTTCDILGVMRCSHFIGRASLGLG